MGSSTNQLGFLFCETGLRASGSLAGAGWSTPGISSGYYPAPVNQVAICGFVITDQFQKGENRSGVKKALVL